MKFTPVPALIAALLAASCVGELEGSFTIGGDDEVDAGEVIPGDPTEPDAQVVVEVDAAPEPEVQDGTYEHPFIIPADVPYQDYADSRDTSAAPSDWIDVYPPTTIDESGTEYFYRFTLTAPARVHAWIDSPEPDGVDVDVHLLRSIEPLTLITRGNYEVRGLLEAGTYWLVLDTYVSGAPLPGPYALHVHFEEISGAGDLYFNEYVLAAVDYLYANYGLLGYASQCLTHDIEYGDLGTIYRSGDGHTMCVAAAMEVILTAMQLYAEGTGDDTVWSFLPKRSWESLSGDCIKAHIWVNHELDSWGTADALVHFGMGETVPFEQLKPGSFINLNRTTGSGHAVVFLAFIDLQGNEYDTWNADVIGFKYFSSQGSYDAGVGGLDYRYAIFSDYGEPEMPYKRDVNVIYSTSQHYLNTGMMLSPAYWSATAKRAPGDGSIMSEFDPDYFDGRTIDDPQ